MSDCIIIKTNICTDLSYYYLNNEVFSPNQSVRFQVECMQSSVLDLKLTHLKDFTILQGPAYVSGQSLDLRRDCFRG